MFNFLLQYFFCLDYKRDFWTMSLTTDFIFVVWVKMTHSSCLCGHKAVGNDTLWPPGENWMGRSLWSMILNPLRRDAISLHWVDAILHVSPAPGSPWRNQDGTQRKGPRKKSLKPACIQVCVWHQGSLINTGSTIRHNVLPGMTLVTCGFSRDLAGEGGWWLG